MLRTSSCYSRVYRFGAVVRINISRPEKNLLAEAVTDSYIKYLQWVIAQLETSRSSISTLWIEEWGEVPSGSLTHTAMTQLIDKVDKDTGRVYYADTLHSHIDEQKDLKSKAPFKKRKLYPTFAGQRADFSDASAIWTAAVKPTVRVTSGDHFTPFIYFGYQGIQDVCEKTCNSRAGEGIVVAVLDSGLDRRHRMYCKSIDWDNNVQSFIGKLPTIDETGHGTHVTGIIRRIAPAATLLIGQCMGGDPDMKQSPLADGIRWAVQRGVHVISISLAKDDYDDDIHRAVMEAELAKVVIVCAASNEGQRTAFSVGFPASLGNVLCVGGSVAGLFAVFSSRGREIDFLAPSVEIYSTVPLHISALRDAEKRQEWCDFRDGTSMATPFIAALAAIILQLAKPAFKNTDSRLTNHQMRLIIRTMCTSPGAHTESSGYGNVLPMSVLKYHRHYFTKRLEEIVGKQQMKPKTKKQRKTPSDKSSRRRP